MAGFRVDSTMMLSIFTNLKEEMTKETKKKEGHK
jgi:hypothetical protein